MITNSLAEVFSRNETPNSAELEQVVVELKKQHKHYSDANQGYYDRLQRGCSWLAKAKRIATNPEAEFVFAWIALNSLCGVRPEVLKTLWWEEEQKLHPAFRHQQTERVLGEMEWFLWRIAGLDNGGRILRDVVMRRVKDIKTIIQTRYLMPNFWNWKLRTEKDIKLKTKLSERKVQELIGDISKVGREQLYKVLSEIILWRLRTLRNQLFHGCATDTHSKRRDAGESELETGTRILIDMVWAFITLMATEAGQSSYWPPIPFPRANSPQHQQFDPAWLSPMS